ncbi:MAG: DHH family phosphoesterase [Anaerolineaceae bacterium]|nr:DHH family phosphoesterase [Anaerolineaceae bacterium]
MRLPIYVIGHVNPDTDSIAAAIGYAWLLKSRDNADVIAARSGVINQQTSWLLNYLGLEIPFLLSDASPRFEAVALHFDTTTPEKPLHEAWAIASRTGGIAPVLNPNATPFGIITGESLFTLINQMIGPVPGKNDVTLMEILSLPCEQAADTTVERFNKNIRIRDVIKKILREEHNEFWVIDDDGKYFGIVRQRELLNPPRLRLILVDHNEAQQAVSALEEAELIEILDHHRLGNLPTNAPIKFTVEPVGSTSTLVTERIIDAGLAATPEIAGLLLAGIISDTLNLISPTTTERDNDAITRLARWAFNPTTILKNDTVDSFAKKLLEAGTGLSSRPPDEIVSGDLKTYTAGGFKFGIAQAEVSDLYELDKHLNSLTDALRKLRESKGFNFAVLMITDVVRGSSRLLMENAPPILEDLPFRKNTDGTLIAKDIVSRKKQLVPAILSLME